MSNNTNQKWTVPILELTFTQDTLKLCFPEELSFIEKNNWRFLQNMPAVITSMNENKLSVSALLEIRRLIDGEAQVDAARKADEERMAKYNVSGHSLTGAHVRQ